MYTDVHKCVELFITKLQGCNYWVIKGNNKFQTKVWDACTLVDQLGIIAYLMTRRLRPPFAVLPPQGLPIVAINYSTSDSQTLRTSAHGSRGRSGLGTEIFWGCRLARRPHKRNLKPSQLHPPPFKNGDGTRNWILLYIRQLKLSFNSFFRYIIL